MGNLDFLSIDTGSLIFTLINTIILFLILKHFLFGRVNKAIENRQKDISSAYQKADETMENAKRLEADYTELMANAKEESAEIIKAASQKAVKRSDEIIQNAKNEAANITNKANEEIELEYPISLYSLPKKSLKRKSLRTTMNALSTNLSKMQVIENDDR